jgi:transcriptional regulator GlxA family with amidase domain
MEHYQQIIASKLLTLMKTNTNRACPSASLTSFEHIDDYIGRNLKQDIDLESLASQANMSLRSLCALFEHHVQTTPRKYIRQRKLESVHACLADPTCNVGNVTELALDYGFLRPGRFSQSYHQQVGELPSTTLKRRCCRSGSSQDHCAVANG